MKTEMIERAIEIEGLLRIMRDGSPSKETLDLLKKKAGELYTYINALEISNPPEKEEDDPQPLSDIMPEESEENDIILALDEDEGDASADDIIEINTETKPKPSPKTLNLKGKFSLNDRFLYARELFEGNMKMFDSTLAFLEGIDSFKVIEDYFFNELEWDKDNRFVASFIETLRPNFKD